MDAREIQSSRADKFDLIFSNAALHWVDDHQAILRGAASVSEARRTAGRFLRRQGQCAGRFCRVAAGNAAETLARILPPDAEAVFFLQRRRITKNGCRGFGFKIHRASSSRRRTRLTPGAMVLPRGCARPGCLTSSACRKICARNSSPPSRIVTSPNIRRMRKAGSMSAWCGWKLTR